MKYIHKHVICIDKPLKHNPFKKYGSCMPIKMSKAPHSRTAKYKTCKTTPLADTPSPPIDEDDTQFMDDPDMTQGVAGQHFHMDFGFVGGSSYSLKQEDMSTVTSIDGYNSYLIIIDRVTKYG